MSAPLRLLRRPFLLSLALLAAALALLVAVWVATPRPRDLPQRVAARERATGVRAPVPLSDVSLLLRQALVATEDERFYRNHGIDLLGIARALPYDLVHLSFAQGASTITDQLAKLLYLNGNDHSLWRKLEDLAVSLRISTSYSKEQVLDAYLNTALFGEDAYGIGAASERYFGVSPHRLTLAQASLLAGLVQAPSAYDPLLHPLAARERQVDVLRSMVRDGYATSEAATRVLQQPLPLRRRRPLPPLRGVIVASQPAFAWGGLAEGALLLVAATVGAVLVRRLPRPSRARVAVRAAILVCLVLGALTVTTSYRAL